MRHTDFMTKVEIQNSMENDDPFNKWWWDKQR